MRFAKAGVLKALVCAILASGLLAFSPNAALPTAFAQAPPPAASTPAPPTFPPTPSQSGNQTDTPQKLLAIVQLILDILQGKQSPAANLLFQASKQSAQNLVNQSGASDLFFLDFGDPALRINQYAATLAGNLLALTPLYVFGYLAMLVYNVWQERPVPNPLLYAILVLGVMIFLAAFGVITQGIGEVGRAFATGIGGAGDAMYVRATLPDTITRVLANLQEHDGVLSTLALLAAIVESIIILIQLAYRGLSMAIWRLIGVLLIPVSVLLEGSNPKGAGRVISGFFEAWLDMVGKITLLLLVLSLAASDSFGTVTWLILPAGLLVVVLSWKFLGIIFVMIRDSVARAWVGMVPEGAAEDAASLPAAAEAARARDIDEERRRLLEE